MAKVFQTKNGKTPFPRTEGEIIQNAMMDGLPYEQAVEKAKHKMRQEVFGHDFKTDAKGNPIEVGLGSKHQQTRQHEMALQKAEGARAAMRSKVGYTSAVGPGAFDPKSAA
jgi:hypothetical protein